VAGETTITIVGNLTADVELRYTQSGKAVASGVIASTARTYDRASGEWKDGESLFLRWSVWEEFAENVAASLTKGMTVIAQGQLRQRSYETKEGEKRTSIELQIEHIGPSLRRATAVVTRSAGRGRGDAAAAAPAGQDGWGAPGGSDAWGAPANDDPNTPF